MQEKNRARALRRHHRERLKKNRKSYWGRGRRGLEWTPVALGICVNTPHPCSCWACGNSRKWLGEVTVQERRIAQLSVWEELAAAGPQDDTTPATEEATESPLG